MIRVLLVDDQALVRSGFRVILETEPDIEVVGEAADGHEAVRLAVALHPDVICMDVEMPALDGIEATARILAASAEQHHAGAPGRAPAVLVLTTFSHDEALFRSLTAGVRGFLLKTARAEQLIEAVRTLAAGHALLSPDVTRAVMERAARAPGAPDGADATRSRSAMDAVGLTEREREVLRLVAAGRSNGEIARGLFLGEATVKTHVSKLLHKIGARDRIQLVVWAHEHAVREENP